MKYWEKDPRGTTSNAWLDLISKDGSMTHADGQEEQVHWHHAAVKIDGSIHFNSAGNIPFCKSHGFSDTPRNELECDSYLYIADIDDMIKRLLELKEIAKNHFGDDWS